MLQYGRLQLGIEGGWQELFQLLVERPLRRQLLPQFAMAYSRSNDFRGPFHFVSLREKNDKKHHILCRK